MLKLSKQDVNDMKMYGCAKRIMNQKLATLFVTLNRVEARTEFK